MFDTLTAKLDGTFKKLRSRGKLHPKQVDNALDDMRTALLEADVAVEVADGFLERVRARALSAEVMKSLTPAQQVIKVVRDELQETLGGEYVRFVVPSARTADRDDGGRPGFGEDDRLREARASVSRRTVGGRCSSRPTSSARPRSSSCSPWGRRSDVPVVSEGRDPVKVAKAA